MFDREAPEFTGESLGESMERARQETIRRADVAFAEQRRLAALAQAIDYFQRVEYPGNRDAMEPGLRGMTSQWRTGAPRIEQVLEVAGKIEAWVAGGLPPEEG